MLSVVNIQKSFKFYASALKSFFRANDAPKTIHHCQNVYFYGLMVFLQPLFLWALAAVSVPVIIHLFNFRRYKKVYFTNVRFLRELQLESKSRSRLKELLILISRCLLITCLVLAFAQPVFHEDRSLAKTSKSEVSIYIDNSFSMENVNKQGALLEIAKNRAREIVNALRNTERFQIITNDFEGRHQRFNTRDNALQVINDIKISPVVRPLSDVYQRQADFLSSAGSQGKKVYLISDAQKSSFDLEKLKPDTSILTNILPLASNRVNNLYIDTCWFEDPLQQKGFIQKLHVRIYNGSEAVIEAGLAKLTLNNKQQAIASFTADAGSSNEVLFTFECKEAGFHFGSVKVEDYPVTFDDEFFFSFNSRVNINVCVINGKDQPDVNAFSSLFSNDSLFTTRAFREQSIDYNLVRRADVLVLNQLSDLSSGFLSELVKFSSRGGAIILLPSHDAQNRYASLQQTLALPLFSAPDTSTVRMQQVDLATRFFSGVFEKIDDRINLPVVTYHYPLIKHSRSNYQSLLRLQNGDEFLASSSFSNGTVYFFTSPLDAASGNFVKHALFVPVFYQMCFKSLRTQPVFFNVSENVVISLRSSKLGEQPPHIKKNGSPVDIIPEIRSANNNITLLTNNQVSEPGFYQVMHADSALLPLAFNYPRRESALECYGAADLEKIIADKGWKKVKLVDNNQESISRQVVEGSEGKKLWKLFIFLALAFMAAEVALLRFLR
jgi:hypothetical protein